MNVIPIKKTLWQKLKDFIRKEKELAKQYRQKQGIK